MFFRFSCKICFGDSITDASNGLCVHYPISIKYGVIEAPGISINELNGDHYFYHPGCDKLMVGMKMRWLLLY